MTIWPPKPDDLKRPVYRSLAEYLACAVESGEFKHGDTLPTHRELASTLGLSVQTVSRAYGELIQRGLLSGQTGRGTFVRSLQNEYQTPFLTERQESSVIDCSILKPVSGHIHTEYMQRALSSLARNIPAMTIFSFRPNSVLQRYQTAASVWLKQGGIRTSHESVLITNGATSAMTIALMTTTTHGGLIVAEELSHHTLNPLTRYLGMRIKGLRIDREGILPEDFANACETEMVKTLYVMPNGLNPTATVMSIGRRKKLSAIARTHNVMIVENDAWGPLGPNRPPPFATLAPERTFYFTSFSKCIMPGLRVGYLIVPDAFQSAVANRHLVTSWVVTPLMAEIASRWIEDGSMQTMLEWQREALGKRNRLMCKILKGIPFFASSNGLHIWVPLPDSWSEDTFISQVRAQGVAVAPGSIFAVSGALSSPGIRICLGEPSLADLEFGVGIIATMLRHQSEPDLLCI